MVKKSFSAALLLCALALSAAVIEGINFPGSMEAGGKKLVLNGMGLRLKRVVVNVKVYAAGLYLEQKESDPAKILGEDRARALRLHFIHSSVSKEKLGEAFIEGFEANCGAEAKKMKADIDRFIAFWPDMAEGDVADIIYVPGGGTRVVIKGREAGTVEGEGFGKMVFSIWLGPKPPNEELKAGLLGK